MYREEGHTDIESEGHKERNGHKGREGHPDREKGAPGVKEGTERYRQKGTKVERERERQADRQVDN